MWLRKNDGPSIRVVAAVPVAAAEPCMVAGAGFATMVVSSAMRWNRRSLRSRTQWSSRMGWLDHFNTIVWAWIGLAVAVFVVLLWVPAPYGRHGRPGWGPKVPPRLGWVLMEAPAPVVFMLCFFFGRAEQGAVAYAFLLLWQLHYVHRAFVFPWRIRAGARGVSLTVLLSALAFNSVNALLNGLYLFVLALPHGTAWAQDPRFVAGNVLFVVGLGVNLHADTQLMRLRAPGESGYRIPCGGLFRWVSCPNYLGEILEWSGWALATWSLPGLAFAAWVWANLVPRALSNHRWYRERFPAYPRERSALFPYLL